MSREPLQQGLGVSAFCGDRWTDQTRAPGDEAADCSHSQTCGGSVCLPAAGRYDASVAVCFRSRRDGLLPAAAWSTGCALSWEGCVGSSLPPCGQLASDQQQALRTAPLMSSPGRLPRHPPWARHVWPIHGHAGPCEPGFERILSGSPWGQSLRSQSGRQDSNLRPSAPKAPALPSCATPRCVHCTDRGSGLCPVQPPAP